MNKFIYMLIGATIMGGLLFAGCNNEGAGAPQQVAPQIDNTNRDLKASTDTVRTTTSTIKDNANQGLTKTPANVMPVLQPHWQQILVQVGIQEKVVKDLERSQSDLTVASQKANDLQSAYTQEHAKRIAAESNATKELRAKYTWVSLTCFSLAIIATVIALSGYGGNVVNKLAVGVSVTCGIGLVVSIALVQTVAIIPYIVGGGAIIAGGYVIYLIWQKNKTITTTTAAVNTIKTTATQLVHTVEAAKPLMTLSSRKKMFGDGPSIGDAHSIQNDETRAFVRSTRATMTNTAPSIPETVAQDYNGDGILNDLDIEYHNQSITRAKKRTGGKRISAVSTPTKTIIILK